MLDGHSPWRSHVAQSAALIYISLFLLPLDTFILALSYVLGFFARPGGQRTLTSVPKTVLVTGVGMSKGLALARTFYQAGHRVIGADFEPYGVAVCGRFSKALSKYYALAKPNERDGSARYIHELLKVVRTENIDLWISCSGVASAVEDGEAMQVIEKSTDCKAIQFDVKTTATLHEKHSFVQHTKSLGLPAPETYNVTSRDAVHKVLHKPAAKKYIMKSVGVDDATRGNMTLLPRRTLSQTYSHVSEIPISPKKPWVLQQYIQGKEYCTHALVVKGTVKAFVACPSLELLMHYEALPPESALSRAMLKFTKEFVARSDEGMTGHLSFDFLVEESVTEHGIQLTFYPIECNPRAHTAVILFKGQSTALAESYLSTLDHSTANGVNGYDDHIVTSKHPEKYYWVGHDLIALVLYPLLRFLIGKLSRSEFLRGCYTFAEHVLFWKDGTFEIWDPLPWWWLYHVYWPGQFLMCILQRRKWSRINVSTTKMFVC